ncbi:MAG: hypothetical protein J5608_01010 [Alphaproteobacteria bacterium]|nr:hypothetical protein [Alphaproteobacteria bacterium]
MKIVSKYNLRLVLGMVVLSLAGCEKEPVVPDTNQNVPAEKFFYTVDMNFYRPEKMEMIPYSAFADTVREMAKNDAIKKIHVSPYASRMFQDNNNLVPTAVIFDTLYNRSNAKLSGDRTTLVLTDAMLNNQTVSSVLQGKLGINIVRKR